MPYPEQATKAARPPSKTATGTGTGGAAQPVLAGPGGKPADAQAQWAQQVSAWLAPLLIASVDAAGRDHGQEKVFQDEEDYLEQSRAP